MGRAFVPPSSGIRLFVLGWSLAAVGCASHADFVKTQEEVRAVARAQDQDRKRDEDLQRRLQSLETKMETKAVKAPPTEPATKGAAKELESLRQQMQELSDRLNDLDRRVARIQDSQYSASVPAPVPGKVKPEATPGGPQPTEPSRQSKPARVPEPPPVLPGTPDISPTSAYNLAYNDYLNGRYELAISGFERFLKDFPATSLAANAHYWIGESYYSLKDYGTAVQAFDLVVHEYPRSEKVAPALFKLGLCAAETGDPLKARSYLKRVIEEFGASNEAKLAKNKLAELR
jgi:tol-pal system protein YbgF